MKTSSMNSSRRSGRVSVKVAATSNSKSASRAVIILPGLGNNAKDYDPLKCTLQERGCYVESLPVSRLDWSRNASGLIYKEYWTGDLSPRPTVDWYLRKIFVALETAKRETDGAPVTLLAHSAGGWLGRVFMKEFGTRTIDRFVSLGSPHLPPPKGVIDQTRGILTFVNRETPGAYHDKVQYVTVAGKYLRGAELNDSSASLEARIVGAGYKQTCGSAEVDGDGIVPVDIAHLDGAVNLTIDGAYHSPLGAGGKRRWYGDKGMVEQWVHYVDGGSSLLGSTEGVLEVGEILKLD